MNKIIKTEQQYHKALEKLEQLMLANPDEGSTEAEELELIALLLETYEAKHVDIPPPTAIEAIKFRMDQMDYKQKDLVEFIGNKARVSEVLAGKRTMTVEMIRNLSKGLNISSEILLGENETPVQSRDVSNYPVAEMHKNGWFPTFAGKSIRSVKSAVEQEFLKLLQSCPQTQITAFNRTGFKVNAKLDEHALHAWRCYVLQEADKQKLPAYNPDDLTTDFFRSLANLTQFKEGPKLVIQALKDRGIAVVITKHLPKTYLDGAAMKAKNGRPVIGLTLRYDRLDNFWHTLMHELGHVHKHLDQSDDPYFDDMDSGDHSKPEKEADTFALNTLIPSKEWSSLRHLSKAAEIRQAAKRLAIHPSIIAGRLRKEHRDYRKHRTLVGTGQVRQHFYPSTNK